MDIMTDFDLSQIGQPEDIDIDVDFGPGQHDEDLDFGDLETTNDATNEHHNPNPDTRDEMMEEDEDGSFAMIDADDFGMNQAPEATHEYDIDISDTHDSFWNQNEKDPIMGDDAGAVGTEATYEPSFDAEVGQGGQNPAGNGAPGQESAITDESLGQVADGVPPRDQDLEEGIDFQDFAAGGQSFLETNVGPEGTESVHSEDQQQNLSDGHDGGLMDREDKTAEHISSQEAGQNTDNLPLEGENMTHATEEDQGAGQSSADAQGVDENDGEQEYGQDQEFDREENDGPATAEYQVAEDEHVEWEETNQDETEEAPSFTSEHATDRHDNAEDDSHIDTPQEEELSVGEHDEGEGSVPGEAHQHNPRGLSATMPSTGMHHQVLVNYGETEYRLFAKSDEDDPNQYFLSDTAVLHSPLREFMAGLREVISEELSPLDELLIHIDGLGLEFGESMNTDFLQNNSFSDILTVWDMLVQNDDLKEPQQLYIFLIVRPSCIQRLSALISQANSGRGLCEVAVYRQGVPSQPPAEQPVAAYADEQRSFDNEDDDEEQEAAAEDPADDETDQLDQGGASHDDTNDALADDNDGPVPIDTGLALSPNTHDLQGDDDQDDLDGELFAVPDDTDADADAEQVADANAEDPFASNAAGDDEDDEDVYEQTLGSGGQFASFANEASLSSSATATEHGDEKDLVSFDDALDNEPPEQIEIQSVSDEPVEIETDSKVSANNLQVPEDEITWESDNEDLNDELTTAAESTVQVSPSSRKRDRAEIGEESDAKRHRS